jgi:hypothetical protein
MVARFMLRILNFLDSLLSRFLLAVTGTPQNIPVATRGKTNKQKRKGIEMKSKKIATKKPVAKTKKITVKAKKAATKKKK